MSCRRYSSRTIFWTFPLFVDLTKTLLDMFEAYGSEAKDLLRLVMVAVMVLIFQLLLALFLFDSDLIGGPSFVGNNRCKNQSSLSWWRVHQHS
jgi:hypothetical protein